MPETEVYHAVLGMINLCPKLIAFADLQLIEFT